MSDFKCDKTIIIRGGGDMATGVIQKFHRAGFSVLVLETPTPTAIRRGVSLSEAVYDGVCQVEDVVCRRITATDEMESSWQDKVVPLLIDPDGSSIGKIMPSAVIDAIMAKRNMGTAIDMADVTIALGPGFCAGKDVHAVIETMRGHHLGKLILQGYAKPDTGVPGEVGGESVRRVLRAPADGAVSHIKQIGDIVRQGDAIFAVGGIETRTSLSGLVRGLIREGTQVCEGMKIADIDPRADVDWRMISDKARCIGGAALEAYFYIASQRVSGKLIFNAELDF